MTFCGPEIAYPTGHNGEGGRYDEIDFKNFYALRNGILDSAVVGANYFELACLWCHRLQSRAEHLRSCSV